MCCLSCRSQVFSLRHRSGEERASALKQEAGAHRQGASGGRCAAHCLGGRRQRRACAGKCAHREPPAAAADSLTPITARHVLAVVPADTNLIGATAGVTETVIGEFMGAVNPPCPCPLLSVCCLRASQARLRAVLRVCAPSSALSRAPVHAARGDVRLVGRGGRGEVRGRDARATGSRAEVPDISVFVCAYLGTP